MSLISCAKAKSISSSSWGWRSDCVKFRLLIRAWPAEGGERDPDQGQQAQHGQDEDQDDPPALVVVIVC